MTAPAPVRIAGLVVPAALAPRIIAALRDAYPEVTADKDDDAAVRASLIEWVTSTLVAAEGKKADALRLQAHQNVDNTFTSKIAEAREKARLAAETIMEAPPVA